MMRVVLAALLMMAAPVSAATERVGSVDDVAVIDRLDVADLAAGQVHRFWFRAGTSALSQPWLVPVIVVKGAMPGPRLLVTAAIHGDELNGIDVVHRLARIDPKTLSGTLVMVPGLNTPGLLQGTREWTPNDSRAAPNLNRVMPGEDGGRGIDDYAGRLWHRLMRPNADQAVDLHTQSRGTSYPMYVFASTPRAVRMAELVAPDIIKLDQGEKGTVENEMVRAGVPAITLELGKPEVFDAVMVGRAEAGLVNLMREMGMLAGAVAPRSDRIFVGNKQAAARASKPGFAHWSVALNDDVKEGQEIGTISDGFGRIIERVVAPVAGRISMLPTDPRRDRGDTMARIIHMSDAPECAEGC